MFVRMMTWVGAILTGKPLLAYREGGRTFRPSPPPFDPGPERGATLHRMVSLPTWAVVLVVVHLLGFVTSLVALLQTRTAQGTLAWLIALNALPWLALPAWWLFGRRRFEGYVSARTGRTASCPSWPRRPPSG
jgi:hypothetical protein